MYNILYINHLSGLIGAERSLLTLLQEIDASRFNPVIVCPFEGPLVEKIRKLGYSVEIIPMRWWVSNKSDFCHLLYGLRFRVITVFRILKIIKRYHIDLVHTNSIVVIEGAIAAKIARIPHIWHIRELLDDDPYFKFVLGTKSVFRLVSFFSTRIICISNAVKKKIAEYCSTDKTVIIYNGVSLSEFKSSIQGEVFRKRFKINSSTLLVGIVGIVIRRKGHKDFIRAAAEVRQVISNVKFVIVGSVDKQYLAELKNLVVELNLEKDIIFTGFQKNIPAVMRTIDLLVVPSWAEPFGRVIIEAMAAEKPVIAANTGGPPEIIVNGKTGLLIPPKNPTTLAKAIVTLLQNPEKAKTMGKMGYLRVKEKFSAELYVKNIENVYLNMLK